MGLNIELPSVPEMLNNLVIDHGLLKVEIAQLLRISRKTINVFLLDSNCSIDLRVENRIERLYGLMAKYKSKNLAKIYYQINASTTVQR